MKRIVLLAVFCLISAVYASAQYKDYYVTQQEGQEYPSVGWFRIDWQNKLFYFDSDSEKEQDGRMLNFKENGNKRTFDAWTPAQCTWGNEKVFSGEFITDEEHKFTLIQVFPDGNKFTYHITDIKPIGSSSDGPGGENPVAKLKNKVTDGISKGFSKGLNALKKKKKND